MATIINIDKAIKNSALFNVLIEPISDIIDNRVEQDEKEDTLKYVFAKSTSSRAQELIKSRTGMGDFKLSQDMGAPELLGTQDGYSKLIEHYLFKAAFVISKTTMEDKQMGEVKPKAIGFIKSYTRKRDKYGWGVVAGGLSGQVNVDGTVLPVKSYDTVDGAAASAKQLVFTKLHKPIAGTGYTTSQSNKFYYPITTFADRTPELYLNLLGAADERISFVKDDRGETLDVKPNILLMPKYQFDVNTMKRALESAQREGMGDNSINPQMDDYKIVTNTRLREFAGFAKTDHAFLLIDTEFNADQIGGVWYDRVPLEVEITYDKTNKAILTDGRARFSAHFINWRYIAYITLPESDLASTTTISSGVVNSKTESELLVI